MKFSLPLWLAALAALVGVQTLSAEPLRTVQVKTADGIVEGVVSPDNQVRTFKGIPYAMPPVGALRWKEPQPVVPWSGVLRTVDFQKRAMQAHIFDDMVFKDEGPSEDCLYLNLWMPENNPTGKLPVMVWIHGGGLVAGASSEPRQDGGNLCKRGVMVVSMNYRMGVFGFLAHPELTKESGHNASGNYGLLDQVAALRWVKRNIAAFGGDPDNVTIFGESAGSFSVSGLMASPLAKGLFHKAIGESGAFFGSTMATRSLETGEKAGLKFAETAFGTTSIETLRAKSAQEIMDASMKALQGSFGPMVDGYYLPSSCEEIFKAGRQSHVPLLAGWNMHEGGYEGFFDKKEPTLANYVAIAKERFGADADAFLKVYRASNDKEAKAAAGDLGGDHFIAYGTWKWLETHLATGEAPVYRYRFDQTMPLPKDAKPGAEPRAYHSAEIEFVFDVLWSKDLPWQPEHHETQKLLSAYWTNFAKTGNPNGPGLPVWPEYSAKDGYRLIHLKAKPEVLPDDNRPRYLFLEHQTLTRID